VVDPVEIKASRDRVARRLERLNSLKDKIENRHSGREIWFTYHAGWDLGYLKGQISILEEMEDLLNDLVKDS